jgi:hypothetical protein
MIKKQRVVIIKLQKITAYNSYELRSLEFPRYPTDSLPNIFTNIIQYKINKFLYI